MTVVIERTDEWTGRNLLLRPGDKFKVLGLRGIFTFTSYERNTETGAEWVCGIGGKRGHELSRAFRPERIVGPKAVTQPRGPRKGK